MDNQTCTIGLTGLMQSGKTTVAMLLYQMGFEEATFANPLKEAVRVICGFNDSQLYGNQKEVIDPYWGTSPRKVMQVVGTDLFRNELPRHIPELHHIWIRALHRKLTYADPCSAKGVPMIHPGSKVVISDIRFQDEYEMVKSLPNAHIWEIKRDAVVASVATHASEGFVCTDPHEVIHNNGSLADLECAVNGLIHSYGIHPL